MQRHLVRLLVAMGLLSIIAFPAAAQTVDDIIKRGKVIIGVNTTTPIFGILGRDGQPEGYDPDVARLLGKYLGVPVEFVPVTAANRISFLLSNRIDMIIALFGITPERAQQVWYSIPYGAEAAVLVGPESRKVKSVEELAGFASAPRRDPGSDPDAVGARFPPTSCATTMKRPWPAGPHLDRSTSSEPASWCRAH